MARCIAQVALDRKNHLPEDVIVNTWHFESDGSFDSEQEELGSRLASFYIAMADTWSGVLAGTGTISMYDYDDAKPRVPVYTLPFNFGTLADAMPSEVCICLSMTADVASGEIKARRRGRVYLGPLGRNVSTFAAGETADGRPPTATLTGILDRASTMARGSLGSFRLAVFSPATKTQGGTDDEAWNDVTSLWVDNAFDIQRRRGARPTAKTIREL